MQISQARRPSPAGPPGVPHVRPVANVEGCGLDFAGRDVMPSCSDTIAARCPNPSGSPSRRAGAPWKSSGRRWRRRNAAHLLAMKLQEDDGIASSPRASSAPPFVHGFLGAWTASLFQKVEWASQGSLQALVPQVVARCSWHAVCRPGSAQAARIQKSQTQIHRAVSDDIMTRCADATMRPHQDGIRVRRALTRKPRG